MNFIKRIFILVIVLAVIAVGASMLIYASRVFSFTFFSNIFQIVYQDHQLRVILVALAIILLLQNYIFFRLTTSSLRGQNIIAFDNPAGRVSVSVAAIEDLIRRMLVKSPDVKDVKTFIQASRKGLNVRVKLILHADQNIPAITSRIQDQVNRKIQDLIGLHDPIHVSVFVDKILSERGSETKRKEHKKDDDDFPRTVPFQGYRA